MWPRSEHPLLLLAPMDGITDSPFRQMVKAIAPDCLVFSEFISARELASSREGVRRHLTFSPIEGPLIVQLYGKDPEDFARSAELAESCGASGIDINMGCPSRTVVAHSHGSALMKDIGLSCHIIEKVKSRIGIPVSVKTRLGWDNHLNLIPFISQLQNAGLDAVTIHGRTYSQKFLGKADWKPIYELKKALRIPVFGNGDITDPGGALAKLKNLDGIMVGRAATWNPWIMKYIAAALRGEKVEPESREPLELQLPYWLEFLENMIHQRSELAACRRFRKYLLNLIKENHLPQELRELAIRVETREQAVFALDAFLAASRVISS